MPTYVSNKPQENMGGNFSVPPGEYNVEIIGAKEATSKGGNEMIVLDVQILPNGPKVRDYLVFTAKSTWKIDNVRAACGEAVIEGESVEITPETFLGKTARCVIGEEPGTNNPDLKFNKIDMWILPKNVKAKEPAKATSANEDDDIPF